MKRLFFIAALAMMTVLTAEQVTFYPDSLMSLYKGRGHLTDSIAQIPVRANLEYIGVMRFDTEALKQIPDRKIESVELSFVCRSLQGTGGGTLEFRPLKKNISEYKVGEALPVSELTDQTVPPLFSYALPNPIETGARQTVALPATDELLAALQHGVAITLARKSGDVITQLSIAGCQRDKKGSQEHYIRLVVHYSSPADKLKLTRRLKPVSGQFVTRKGADFYYNGEPIRFFGVNMSGSFKNRAEVDLYIDRLLAMNVNAVRLWMHRMRVYTTTIISENLEFTPAEKGDDSYWDCVDYLLYRCQEEGIFINSTLLQALPYLSKEDEELGHAFTYVSDRYKEIKIQHMRQMLDRVNQYTGQRYAEMPVFATWELNNENGTVPRMMSGGFRKWTPAHQKLLTDKWNAFLLKRYRSADGLTKAWGELKPGEDPTKGSVEAGPIYGEVKEFPNQRASDFLEFIQEMYMTVNRELETVARSCAPSGVGINVAPIIHSTHTYVNLHGQYADGIGDFTACGIYQTPYTSKKDSPFFPYLPFVTQRPHFYNIHFQASANKPFMIYEFSFHRPYRYRVEYVPVLAMLGAGLGWDAYYFYNFSTPATKIAGLSPLIFSGAPLPIPENSTFRGYTAGFRSASDEIVMATLAVTAQAHINGIAPNREKIDVTYGKGAILDQRFRNYSPNPVSKEPIFTELVGGGVMEYLMMPGMYRKLIHASIRTQLGVDFDPEQEAPIRVSGKDLDKIESDEHSVLKNSPDITWDPAAGTVVLDNRHSKILAGVLPKELTFADGVSFRPKKSMFAFFGLSSRDGKAIAESRELVFALTSESENTGYRLNPDKMERGPLALIPAIENRGTTPVIVTRPSGVIHVPGKPFTLKRFNFAGYCYRNETVGDGRITVEEGEPLFLGVITR